MATEMEDGLDLVDRVALDIYVRSLRPREGLNALGALLDGRSALIRAYLYAGVFVEDHAWARARGTEEREEAEASLRPVRTGRRRAARKRR